MTQFSRRRAGQPKNAFVQAIGNIRHRKSRQRGTATNESARRISEKKDRWDIRLKEVDVFYKVIILIIGSAVAGAFLFLQNRQTESHYYTDLTAQREKADTELRAKMFEILFEAYFKNRIQAAATNGTNQVVAAKQLTKGGSPPLLPQDRERQEIMLADLLGRNFDNVDARPLMEDLDRRLAEQVHPKDKEEDAPTRKQHEVFLQRQELRRVAIGAVSRQISALEGATDGGVHVTNHGLDLCNVPTSLKGRELGSLELRNLITPPIRSELMGLIGPIFLRRVEDGAIDLRIIRPGNDPQDVKLDLGLGGGETDLSITFFDMPTLENIRLKDGSRVAFSLYKYLSTQDCKMFKSELDQSLQDDCNYVLANGPKSCAIAQFRVVVLPPKFLGIHDRPYVSDLAAGKYRDPWWKLW